MDSENGGADLPEWNVKICAVEQIKGPASDMTGQPYRPPVSLQQINLEPRRRQIRRECVAGMIALVKRQIRKWRNHFYLICGCGEGQTLRQLKRIMPHTCLDIPERNAVNSYKHGWIRKRRPGPIKMRPGLKSTAVNFHNLSAGEI